MIDRGRQLTLCLHAQVGGTLEKCVLLVLLDYYGNKRNCFPSIATIAQDSCGSLASAKRGIKALQALGVVRVVRRFTRDGKQTSNSYYIDFDRLKELQPATEKPTRREAQGVQVEPLEGFRLTPPKGFRLNRRGVQVEPRSAQNEPPNTDPAKVEPPHGRKVESEAASALRAPSSPPSPPTPPRGDEERAQCEGESDSIERRKGRIKWELAITPLLGRHAHGRHAGDSRQAHADRTCQRRAFDEIVWPPDLPDPTGRLEQAIELARSSNDPAVKIPMAHLLDALKRTWPDEWAESSFGRAEQRRAEEPTSTPTLTRGGIAVPSRPPAAHAVPKSRAIFTQNTPDFAAHSRLPLPPGAG